jgi:hypothetical protein
MNVGYAEKNSKRGPKTLKLIVRIPLAHGVMNFLGHTVEVGIVDKGRKVGSSPSHTILYIYFFVLVEASGDTAITYMLQGRFSD